MNPIYKFHKPEAACFVSFTLDEWTGLNTTQKIRAAARGLNMRTIGSGETIKLDKWEIDNWDHRDGTTGQTAPKDAA